MGQGYVYGTPSLFQYFGAPAHTNGPPHASPGNDLARREFSALVEVAPSESVFSLLIFHVCNVLQARVPIHYYNTAVGETRWPTM